MQEAVTLRRCKPCPCHLARQHSIPFVRVEEIVKEYTTGGLYAHSMEYFGFICLLVCFFACSLFCLPFCLFACSLMLCVFLCLFVVLINLLACRSAFFCLLASLLVCLFACFLVQSGNNPMSRTPSV